MNLAHSTFYDTKIKHLNLWWQGILVLSAFLLVSVLLYIMDHRVLGDEPLWTKPIKFEISVIVHFITLSALASLVSPGRRNGRVWKGMTYVVVAAGLFEVLYIFLQAARGRDSHYNDSTIVETVMYGLMGLGAVALVAGSFYLGCLLFREYQSANRNLLLLSSAIGLILGSILTLIIAGYLSSIATGYTQSSTNDVARMPLFSWYLNGEDLRIPHFFATHMMQLLPLYGLWLVQRNTSFAAGKTRLLWVSGIYSLFVISLFLAAIMLMR